MPLIPAAMVYAGLGTTPRGTEPPTTTADVIEPISQAATAEWVSHADAIEPISQAVTVEPVAIAEEMEE